jgi:hypothetical protein
MSENTTTSNLTADGDRFPSLTAMRNAHSEMLKLHREKGTEPEIIAKIEQLINKGRATGAFLDSEDDRWAAQSLLDYWNSLLYRAGYETTDAILADLDSSLSPDLFCTIADPESVNNRVQKELQIPVPLSQARKFKFKNIILLLTLFSGLYFIYSFYFYLNTSSPIRQKSLSSPIMGNSVLCDKLNTNVSYSPNGNSILTVAEGTANLRNIQGKLLSVIGKEGAIWIALFSPDSKLIATTGSEGNIELWDYKGEKKVMLNGNKSAITGLVFSPDGKFIATASLSGNISLWNIKGTLISVRKDQAPVTSLKFSPNGKFIMSANTDGIVSIWNFESPHPISGFYQNSSNN